MDAPLDLALGRLFFFFFQGTTENYTYSTDEQYRYMKVLSYLFHFKVLRFGEFGILALLSNISFISSTWAYQAFCLENMGEQ